MSGAILGASFQQNFFEAKRIYVMKMDEVEGSCCAEKPSWVHLCQQDVDHLAYLPIILIQNEVDKVMMKQSNRFASSSTQLPITLEDC